MAEHELTCPCCGSDCDVTRIMCPLVPASGKGEGLWMVATPEAYAKVWPTTPLVAAEEVFRDALRAAVSRGLKIVLVALTEPGMLAALEGARGDLESYTRAPRDVGGPMVEAANEAMGETLAETLFDYSGVLH